ncbi:MAG: desulfoferrodoxin family protein [Oscillospiraceae bacterium]|nr:desulfoferrodoxin family protein [Oscillospiraceae bacterium]MDD4413172.1 desulfoferrodoxin family protein [Oscillospiraceae bacterium]
MKYQQFFICKHCGNTVGLIHNGSAPLICCGEHMEELVPNTVDASVEKHVPQAEYKEGIVNVRVGSVDHPMIKEHYIEWVYIQTDKGGQRKALKPGDQPAVTFAVIDDTPKAVFAYCNLHGLWLAEMS